MATLDYLHLSRQPEQAPPPTLERIAVSGGYPTALLVHNPPRRRGLPVLLLHGIQSHPGWFVGSADALAGAGHPVYQYQRRGSGSNARDRGHAASPGQLLDDLQAVVSHVLARTRAERLHLLGVSWGGKYAACYALDARRAGQLASLSLAAPGLVSRVDVPGGRKLGIALAAVLSPKKTFEIPLNDPALFTDNPAMRDYLSVDAHRLRRASARFLVASRRMDVMLGKAPDGTIRVPIHLLLARRDRIIRNDRTRALAERLAGAGIRVSEFDAAHTLEFEIDPQPYFRALVEGVAAHE